MGYCFLLYLLKLIILEINNIRNLFWFTHTNIDTARYNKLNKTERVTIDLTKYIEKFIAKKLWDRAPYCIGYPKPFTKSDLNKIKNIKIDFHEDGSPFSNAHNYENIISLYHDVASIETDKLSSSDIQEASLIAVIIVQYESDHDVLTGITRDEEKNIDIVFEKYLSSENIAANQELQSIKRIVEEFLQFLMFSLHMTFLSKDYELYNSKNIYKSGFVIVTNNGKSFFQSSKIDLLGHYIYYEDADVFNKVIDIVSDVWCTEIPSINFFLNAVIGSHMNIDNFSKLLFTIESFFNNNTSTDFMKLSISMLIGIDFKDVDHIKNCLTESFKIRNEYVHGGKIPNLHDNFSKKDKIIWKLFFELKNITIRIFIYFLQNRLYENTKKQYINDDLVMKSYFDKINKNTKK